MLIPIWNPEIVFSDLTHPIFAKIRHRGTLFRFVRCAFILSQKGGEAERIWPPKTTIKKRQRHNVSSDANRWGLVEGEHWYIQEFCPSKRTTGHTAKFRHAFFKHSTVTQSRKIPLRLLPGKLKETKKVKKQRLKLWR